LSFFVVIHCLIKTAFTVQWLHNYNTMVYNNNNMLRKWWRKGVNKVFKSWAKKHILDLILGKISFSENKKLIFGQQIPRVPKYNYYQLVDWCLTALQHRKVNLCQTVGVWNRLSRLRMANEIQRIIPYVTR